MSKISHVISGYWTDNGAFYYYHTLEGKNYEETLIELTDYFKQSGSAIPVRHLEIDSWWYPKDFFLAVEEWSALENIFPNGLDFLQNRIGLPIVAHNRYWSRNTTYAKENGGSFNFIRGTKDFFKPKTRNPVILNSSYG